MSHNQIYKNEAYNTMHANVLPFYTPLTPVWGQKVKIFCFWRRVWCVSHDAIKCFALYTPLDLGWVKGQTLNWVDK